MRKFVNALLFGAILLSAVSCMSDIEPGGDIRNDVDILLNLRTPGSFSAPATRGLNYAQENTIGNIHVLVFDEATDVLTAVKSGADITELQDNQMTAPAGGISGSGSFKVTLPSSTGGKKSKLVVLANAGGFASIIAGFTLGGTEYDEAIEAIFAAVTGPLYTSGGTIPMWGETGAISIVPANKNQTVRLTRAVARIDVGVGVNPARNTSTDLWTWSGEDAGGDAIPFELASVHLMRSNDRYAAIPAPANVSGGKAIAPTVPTGTTAFTATESATNFGYTAVTSGLYTSRSIYVPEADVKMGGTASGDTNHTERMAIVVGGRYDADGDGFTDDAVSYYRLDFANANGLMNVLRNHLYQFNISKVSGKGYPTPEEAYSSITMNMTVDILDWDEADTGDIQFEGVYYFGISERQVFLDSNGETVVVTIKTNVPDFEMNRNGGTAEIVGGSKKNYSSNGFTYTLSNPVGDTYTLTIKAGKSSSITTSSLHEWVISAKRLNMSFIVAQGAVSLAAPGMIGYIAGTNTLTLKGSKEYAVNAEIKKYADDTFGGLSDQTVYVAFFQFGSLVAISSDGSDSVQPFLEPDDIIAAPSEWKGSLDGARNEIDTNWYGIPRSDPADWAPLSVRNISETPYHNPAIGKGDPCKYYFDNEYNGGGWRLPVGGALDTHHDAGAWNGGTFGKAWTYSARIDYAKAYAKWFDTNAAGMGIPAGARAGDDTDGHPADWSMFLPAVGRRDPKGGICNQGIEGVYWTSIAYENSLAYRLQFFNTYIRPSDNADYLNAFPIRCVQPEKPRGIPAVPGVIGYYADGANKGKLTLDGDTGDANNPVYVAYFKFGSLIAIDGTNEYDDFTADDIVAAPDATHGYMGLGALKAHVAGFDAGGAAWAEIPGITTANNLRRGDNISQASDPAQGLGDPCDYYFGNGWRTPTAVENVQFVGGPTVGTADQTRWQTWVPGDPNLSFRATDYAYWNHNGATHAGTVTDPNTGSFPVATSGGQSAFSNVLPAAGYRSKSGTVDYQGTSGHYWSSTVQSSVSAFYMRFLDTGVDQAYSTDYSLGYAVRCVR